MIGKHYKHRGTRIHLGERFNLLYLCMLYFMPFIVLSGYLGYVLIYQTGAYSDIMHGNWQDSRLIILLIPFVVACLFFMYLRSERSFLFTMLRHCKNRQMIAKRIYHDNMYITQKSKDILTGKDTERIIQYPKIYYKVDGSFIRVSVQTDFAKWQSHMPKFMEELAIALYADTYEYVSEEGYMTYKMLYAPEKSRILVTDIMPTTQRIQLTKNLYWRYASIPHCLVVGGTGSGKTFMILSLLYSFLKIGADVVILDPKKTDLSYLKTIPSLENLVSCKTEDILVSIKLFYAAMLDRQEEFDRLANKQTGLIYSDVGLNPVILVFDEYSAFIGSLDYKERTSVDKWLNQIILLGRQLGFFVILGMQRPDGQDLDTKLRDQFGLRIALGGMSATGYTMMFGETDKTFMSKLVKGFGYASIGTFDVREFYSPLVPEGFNFVEEIGKLYHERQKVGR
ncbi:MULTISPECIES: FtsK/SpoIIIE domain-containing protein [unclassified Granulicatella]|uniref:FtsK/SpoIIIE domain-containing protein n=1 Tax=unclassified Granulicatella TaxID=2630493 RepID=UPI001073CB49|nr:MULTISPECIES: FtsK/SpoIIIE domain-containing protein [unclassified Granulicatella]MBF0780673.1 DUF87 domain-containing protein [Granulicatella sp. 19428wC4_WM01]TFU94250.1 DUF87 domain-containing protein [Granulicatella sp. WM01]